VTEGFWARNFEGILLFSVVTRAGVYLWQPGLRTSLLRLFCHGVLFFLFRALVVLYSFAFFDGGTTACSNLFVCCGLPPSSIRDGSDSPGEAVVFSNPSRSKHPRLPRRSGKIPPVL